MHVLSQLTQEGQQLVPWVVTLVNHKVGLQQQQQQQQQWQQQQWQWSIGTGKPMAVCLTQMLEDTCDTCMMWACIFLAT
jgi:hypothetical protein